MNILKLLGVTRNDVGEASSLQTSDFYIFLKPLPEYGEGKYASRSGIFDAFYNLTFNL